MTAKAGWGGGQIGFNYQFPNSWVVGNETDIDAGPDHVINGMGSRKTASKSGFFQSLFITTHASSNVSIDLVRVGLNYRFR